MLQRFPQDTTREQTERISSKVGLQTIECLSDPLHVIDANLRILSINQALKRWLNLLDIHQILIGQHLSDAFPFLSASVMDEYLHVLETGEVLITSESTLIDGIEIFTETQKIPVLLDGEVIRIVTIIRDVTGRQMLESAFEDYSNRFQRYRITSEERFSSLFNESPVSICVFDEDGILTLTNPACTRMFGLQGEHDLLGYDLFKVPDVPRWVFDMIRAGEHVDFEWVLSIDRFTESKMYETSKTGVMHIGTTVSPLIIGPEHKGWIVQMQDITKQRSAQLELQQAQEIAIAYMDLMSHDIANKLQSMVICAGLLGEVARNSGKGDILNVLDEAVFDCIKIIAKARKMMQDIE